MGHELVFDHVSIKQTAKPIEEFVVTPILFQFLEYNRDTSPSLHMAAVTEQMMLNTDVFSPGYDLLRHQLTFNAVAAMVTTKFSPTAVESFLKLNETYHIYDFLPEIPDSWVKHLTEHGNENPRPPHLQNQDSL